MINVPHDRASHTLSKPNTTQHARPTLSISSVDPRLPNPYTSCRPTVFLTPQDYCLCTLLSLCMCAGNLAFPRCTDLLYRRRTVCMYCAGGQGREPQTRKASVWKHAVLTVSISPIICTRAAISEIHQRPKKLSVWQPTSPPFTDAFLKTVDQVCAAGWSCQGNQKPNILRSSTKACLCLLQKGALPVMILAVLFSIYPFPSSWEKVSTMLFSIFQVRRGFRIDLAYFTLEKNLTHILSISVF